MNSRLGKRTTRNHFVAQFTSRPWLLGGKYFYKLTAKKGAIQSKPTGPKKWGSEDHLYSQEIEDAFQRIETRLAQLHTKLAGPVEPTEDERYGWAMWLLASYLRTPAAFLSSAEMTASMNKFAGDLFPASYAVLAKCVTDPYCIELIANRDWRILTCDKPYFLKPDSGVILTDRLDKDDCTILYPLSPFSCFVATANKPNFTRMSIEAEDVFEINDHILRWSEQSVACSAQFWHDEELLLRRTVPECLASGEFSPPTSGQFQSIDTLKSDGKVRVTLLAPRGPIVMTVSETSIRPVTGIARPSIRGLYDVEDCESVSIGVRYSDDEREVNYAAAAQVMIAIGQKGFALDFARKALQKNSKDLLSKLIILSEDPESDIAELAPENASDAAELAIFLALVKRQPLEGLKISSVWSADHPGNKRLAQANFLCAFLLYGAKLIKALCGKGVKLPYIDDNMPYPDGVVELIKKLSSHTDTDIVSRVQEEMGKIDVKASGLAADISRICGLSYELRLYRPPDAGSQLAASGVNRPGSARGN